MLNQSNRPLSVSVLMCMLGVVLAVTPSVADELNAVEVGSWIRSRSVLRKLATWSDIDAQILMCGLAIAGMPLFTQPRGQR